MQSLFSLLFKYRPFHFSEADLTFQPVLPLWILLAGVVVILCLATAGYWGDLRRLGTAALRLLLLRSGAILVLLLLLVNPVLVLNRMVPQTGILTILVDNSKSLAIADQGLPRNAAVSELLDPKSSEFLEELGENFQLRLMAFDASAGRISTSVELDWSGNQTNLSSALDRALTEAGSLPQAGVVLITDGADNSHQSTTGIINEYAARGIPIHTVGIGPISPERDLEVADVSAPDRVLPGSAVSIRVTLEHPGFRGSMAQLRVRDGSTLVEAREVALSSDSDLTLTEIKAFPEFEGLKTYTVSVDPLQGEAQSENNSRLVLVDVQDRAARILMVEGRPRWDYKFIRQSLYDDRSIRLETLLRTALNKYYRQGIEEETTLAAGFPTRREDLFGYSGLILGDVESAFFSYAQMEMVRDFVGRRGGGLLMLGGASTLGSGGYQNSPVEEALPITLSAGEPSALSSYSRSDVRAGLTRFGENHPALQLAKTSEETASGWADLPLLADLNRVAGVKPGATVLLQGESTLDGDAPLLVSHRFGRGLGLVFLSGSSWRWQMLKDHDDSSHETFWRQVLRWLAHSATDPVAVEVDREVYAQNEPVKIRAEVRDSLFNGLNDARVSARLTLPSGRTETAELQWDSREDGIYGMTWSPREDGLHRVDIEVQRTGSEEDTAAAAYFLVSTGQSEYFDAIQKQDFLKGISSTTGGRYVPIEDAYDLPEQIVYSESSISETEVLPLWNMPINFLLLVALLSAEWVLRRRWGLV